MALVRASSGASSTSLGARGLASHCRGWSWTRPVRAGSRRGSLGRLRRVASAASVAGSARPARSASRSARPATPISSDITAASVLVARAHTPWTRLTARPRAWTSWVRSRVRSRQARCPCGGRQRAGRRPKRRRLANPRAAALSV